MNGPLADEDTETGQEADQGLATFGSMGTTLSAAAVSVEMSPPQPSIARSLRLSPGQPVIMVTIRFDDSATGEPAGLTVVMLKPELFRVAIDTTGAPVTAPLASSSRTGGAGDSGSPPLTAGLAWEAAKGSSSIAGRPTISARDTGPGPRGPAWSE